MTGFFWWDLLLSVGAALIITWLALVTAVIMIRPRRGSLRQAFRLLPDVLRLVRRLAGDRTLPRGIRVRLALLLAYLALPVDLIPDVIPVVGYADDAIIVIAVLRSVVRRAGIDAVHAHWPGTDDGFSVLMRLTGIDNQLRPAPRPAVPPGPGRSVDLTRLSDRAPWVMGSERSAAHPRPRPSRISARAVSRALHNNHGIGGARRHRRRRISPRTGRRRTS
jgi:uncharacterized membrane protein YkvA (DUF1232 family)